MNGSWTIINASVTSNYYATFSSGDGWGNWKYEDPEAYLDNYCSGFDGFVVSFAIRSSTKPIVHDICFHLRYD